MNKSWIEPILENELRPVAAPDELWNRMQRPKRPPVVRWQLVFASVVAVASAFALHPRPASMESARASEIREWVKARTGLDVPLAPSAGVRLCGARVFGSSAEIQFRARGNNATLLIAKADHVARSHEFNGSSWTLRGQTYTSSVHEACLLCHEE